MLIVQAVASGDCNGPRVDAELLWLVWCILQACELAIANTNWQQIICGADTKATAYAWASKSAGRLLQ